MNLINVCINIYMVCQRLSRQILYIHRVLKHFSRHLMKLIQELFISYSDGVK